MSKQEHNVKDLLAKNEDLRLRLQEALDTLHAIRSGEVDALVVSTTGGDRIYSIEGAERTSRLTLEKLNEGVLNISEDGTILYFNIRFAEMLKLPLQNVVGSSLRALVFPADITSFDTLFEQSKIEQCKGEVSLASGDEALIPMQFSFSTLKLDDISLTCIVAVDLTQQKQREKSLETALSEVKRLKDQLEDENVFFRHDIQMKHQLENIVGQSDVLKHVLYRVEQVAPSDTTVLILGETGTGKELIASAIHLLSARKNRPMITVNCAALPANLIESELFGREKGAFTGADTRQVGRFEIANGSTLCLDEIGELPLDLQAKLLRVIQHNEFEHLGSSHTVKVDVRIIATTNRELEEEVRNGLFRKDLYYRLNVFPITVPPLRQRKDDIPLLVRAFVERYGRKLRKQITSIPKEAMRSLQDYPWPGNVRELESVIERSVIMCAGPILKLADKLELFSLPLSSGTRTLQETERNQILNILSETKWRIDGKGGAAEILGLHPSTLRARMHKLGIVRPKTREMD